MKYSKVSAVILAVAIIVQLAVPITIIIEQNKILREGTECRLRVNWLGFDDDDIELNYEILNNWNTDDMRYAALKNETDGVFQHLSLSKDPPEDGIYMKSASVRKFVCPIEEYTIPGIDEDECATKWNELTVQGHYMIAAIKIYQGKALLTGVFLDDGTPAEELFR
jgi:hypothetical protein